MSGLRLDYEIEGGREARRAFRALADAGRDPSPLADAMGQTLTESAVHRLAVTNKAPDGSDWPTSARSRARGGPTQYDRGMLAGSLSHRVGIGGTSVTYGSPLVYAAQRQFGGTIRPKEPGGKLIFSTIDENTGEDVTIVTDKVVQSARPYLGVSAEDEDELAGLAEDFFGRFLRSARLSRGRRR